MLFMHYSFLVIAMKDENWSSIRISEEELKDLHEIKNIVEDSIGKKLRLGEAISYALRQLKSGRFESVNLKELQEKIEITVQSIGFGYHPPSMQFQVEIDNRNTIALRIRQIECTILSVGAYGFDYLPISVRREVEFDAVEKRALQLMFPMDCFLIDLLQSTYEGSGGHFPTITISVGLHFTLGMGGTAFAVFKEMRAEIKPSRWKHMMEVWRKRFPKTFHEYMSIVKV